MVAKELQEQGVAVAMYHAGMGQAARKKSHKAFLCDEVEVVVATVAFGMGINKPDVRLVVNWGAPSDMEAYYQQVGVRCLPLDILTIISRLAGQEETSWCPNASSSSPPPTPPSTGST